MTTEHLFHDVSILYSRLFDHRPVLQGNVNLFLKEFEEKRGNRELDRLKETERASTTISDQIIPDITVLLRDNLPQIASEVAEVAEMTQKLIDRDGQVEKPLLEYQRNQRKEIWKEFMDQQITKSSLVDQDFDKQVKVLQDHYTELEMKLTKATKAVL